MNILLIVLLVLLLCGGGYGFRAGWGPYNGIFGILILLIVLRLFGVI